MTAQVVQSDDMLQRDWHNAGRLQAVAGYRLCGIDESTCAAIFVREGSVPDRQNWSAAEFDRYMNGQGPNLHA